MKFLLRLDNVVASENGTIEEGTVFAVVDDLNEIHELMGDFKISMIPNGDIRAWIHLEHNNVSVAEIQLDYRKLLNKKSISHIYIFFFSILMMSYIIYYYGLCIYNGLFTVHLLRRIFKADETIAEPRSAIINTFHYDHVGLLFFRHVVYLHYVHPLVGRLAVCLKGKHVAFLCSSWNTCLEYSYSVHLVHLKPFD